MPNFPGQYTYPLTTNPTPIVDVCDRTKGRERGIARGGTAQDYNVTLRGGERRIDELPKRPYP